MMCTPFNCLRSQLTHTQFSPHTIITKCNTHFLWNSSATSLSQALLCISRIIYMKRAKKRKKRNHLPVIGVHEHCQFKHTDYRALSLFLIFTLWLCRFIKGKTLRLIISAWCTNQLLLSTIALEKVTDRLVQSLHFTLHLNPLWNFHTNSW